MIKFLLFLAILVILYFRDRMLYWRKQYNILFNSKYPIKTRKEEEEEEVSLALTYEDKIPNSF